MNGDRSRRYWTECKCGEFKSAEGFDSFFPQAEASQHLLQYRFTEKNRDHATFVRWRTVEPEDAKAALAAIQACEDSES